MPGGVNPQSAVPDTTPKLHDSSLQQGDVAMLQEGQQTMKQFQKPAAGGSGTPAPQARPAPNVQVPDAIDFIGGRAGGTVDAGAIGQNAERFDASRWRPLMEQLARDPNASGPITTQLLSQFSNMNNQPSTVGVDVIDMNAATDAVTLGLS